MKHEVTGASSTRHGAAPAPLLPGFAWWGPTVLPQQHFISAACKPQEKRIFLVHSMNPAKASSGAHRNLQHWSIKSTFSLQPSLSMCKRSIEIKKIIPKFESRCATSTSFSQAHTSVITSCGFGPSAFVMSREKSPFSIDLSTFFPAYKLDCKLLSSHIRLTQVF